MPSSPYLLLALTNAGENRDDDYNRWFDDRHIPEVLSVDGIVSAQRYKLADSQRTPGPFPYGYVAAYRLETADLGATLSALGDTIAAGVKTDAGDPARRAIWVLEPLGPERTA